jgi:hypothetical protein
MEHSYVIGRERSLLICGLAFIFLTLQSYSVVFAGSPSFPDDFKVSDYFSFFGSGGIDWQALNDPNNNPILVACLEGIADESLRPPGILDVQKRLERLERGNLIKKVDERYTLAFPALVGVKREKLREYAEQSARQLFPFAEEMIAQIQTHLAGRDEMLYHVLWSVVMDGGPAWDAARAEMDKKIAAGDTSIQNKAWLLYPSHPFRAGTNSWSKSFGRLKVTWSSNTPSPNDIGRIIVRYAAQLTQAIEHDRAVESPDVKDALSKYGLVDEAGNVRFYVTQLDSGVARSYAELGAQFGRQMMTHLDVKKVAEMLEVSPGIAFVIAYHEICWQLLQGLAEKKVLSVPPIVAQAGTNASEAFQLVSLTTIETVKDPLPDTEMSNEEAQAIEEYRRIKPRILAGESYNDSSTPLRAVLTRFSTWKPEDRGSFMGLDILRAPLPPAKPEEGSIWPVYAGDTELADTFILVHSKGQWIWIGNMGSNYDWHLAMPAIEKLAKKKIDEIAKADSSDAQSESEIIEYFENKKSEILKGLKFSDLSTPADALLTLISAYYHQDLKTLEQIFPIVKQEQFKRLSTPEVRAQMLAAARDSILCRIEIEDKPPEESDLCAIYTRESPEKPIDQVWSFAYVDRAWRFAGSTSSMDNWRTQAEQAEVLARNILQSEAEKTGASATNAPQQKANNVEGKWYIILPEFNQKYVVRFWRKPDGTLAGAATLNSSDDRPFDGVTFENGKLRFEEKVNQAVFEGTMKEDGLTIEGEFEKPGILTPCMLKRADDVAIENKGQLKGAPKPDGSAENRVLSLDGEGDYVLVADSQSLRSFSNAITIEVWFKASSFYPENGMVNSIVRKNITAGIENFFLRFRNVAGGPSVEMSVGYDNEVLKAPYNFAVDTWYHLAGTYNGSVITVFLNGVSVNSEIASGSLYIDESDLFIGRGDPEFSSGEFFHGALDELRIWNVARSPEEIQAAMKSPLTGKEDGLVVYLNFDEGTAKDLSDHGNDGVLSENARIVESPYPSSVRKEQQNKLLAWWRLDEADGNDVADSSGNACGGKLIGNPQWRPADGKVGGALEFDGDGDCVQIDDESAFDIEGPITIAAWFKVNTFDKRWQALITKGDTSWRLQRYAEDNTLAFHCTGIVSVTSERPEGIEGKKNVNDGQWHHVVGVYDGSEILLYIDGVLDNSSKASGEISMNDSAVIIGGNSEQSGREWNGLIDEVDIIGGAIDANAVHALYTGADPIIIAQTANPLLQSSDKLIAWWKFEDDVNDSARANHGTLHGNPTYADGKVGRAISLDGNDYVDCGNPDSLNFSMGDWTISAWIKTTQTGTNQDDSTMNRGTVFANGGDESGGIRYALAINEGQLGSITLTTDNDMSKVQAISRTAVNDGAWHHIVGIRSAGQLYVYVDGVLDGGNYLSAGYDLSGTSQHNVYIGVITDNRDGSLYKYFVGLIDEVCIIRGAIDANGVRVLYSGEDPTIVAQTAIISPVVAKPKTRRQPITGADARGGIVGDWQMISDQISTKAFIEIRRESDDSLSATIVPENVADTSQAMSMNNVTFEDGKLRFEVPSNGGAFEGTMKEDGLTIAGEFRQQDQAMAIDLKRVDPVPDETAPESPEQLQAQTHSTSNIATVLILVLVLAGFVGAIVFFLVKSSIR